MWVIANGRNRYSDYTGYVPDDPSLVVDFLNTLNVEEGTDVLADPVAWRRWAHARDLQADPADAARQARSTLRHAVGDPGAAPADLIVPVQIELAPPGPRLVAPDAVGAVLGAAARLAVLGDWERVKICPADDCLWAFYDRSRNRSRTWCSMRVCGNREKARGWRERTTRQPSNELPTEAAVDNPLSCGQLPRTAGQPGGQVSPGRP